MNAAYIPEAVVAMIIEGFSVWKAFRRHAGLDIQYVAARSGISVGRLIVIESGSVASDDEIAAIGRALELPNGVLDQSI